MTNQEIFELIACFDRSSLQTLKLSRQEFSIELARGTAAAPAVSAAPAASTVATAAAAEIPAITAPLVGTYYAASAPDQPPLAAVGQLVQKGQSVCLIEAMKMMSEVPAPCDCVIEEILKSSGQLVSFGEPLFRYRPC